MARDEAADAEVLVPAVPGAHPTSEGLPGEKFTGARTGSGQDARVPGGTSGGAVTLFTRYAKDVSATTASIQKILVPSLTGLSPPTHFPPSPHLVYFVESVSHENLNVVEDTFLKMQDFQNL